MTGTQETLAFGLYKIAVAVESGKYGNDDQVDLKAVKDDIEDLMIQS